MVDYWQVRYVLRLVYQEILHVSNIIIVVKVLLRVPVLQSIYMFIVFLTSYQVRLDPVLTKLMQQVVNQKR